MLFNLHLSQDRAFITESYYELEPEEQIQEELEKQELIPSTSKQTNLAFNETENLKDLDDDYLNKIKEHYEKYAKSTQTEETTQQDIEALRNQESENNETDDEALSTYNKINSLLASKGKNKQSTASKGDNSSEEISITKGANRNSTMSYSLVGRTHEFLPTPIYLCEKGGIIIITISVNRNGKVTQASVNGSSTSSNECLIDHALEYARNARFSEDPIKDSQIGTISFNFVGKN
jgi:outer membrane biosynthesis protein TonB